MKKLILLISVLFLLLTSCTQRIFDFTVISTKNLDLSQMDSYTRGSERVEGTDGVYFVLFVPLGFPNMKEAIDKAIETTPGAVALVDGVVFSRAWTAILTTYTSYIVEGTPLIDPHLAQLDKQEIGKYNYCKLNRKGEIKEFRILSLEEYKVEKAKVQGSN